MWCSTAYAAVIVVVATVPASTLLTGHGKRDLMSSMFERSKEAAHHPMRMTGPGSCLSKARGRLDDLAAAPIGPDVLPGVVCCDKSAAVATEAVKDRRHRKGEPGDRG